MTFLILLLPWLIKSKRVLIFGGNGLLGSEFAHRLLQSSSHYELTLLHRGSNYFDYNTRIHPHVTHLYYDYSEPWRTHPVIKENFDVAVSFSHVDPEGLEEVFTWMELHVKYYVYISTDSIYDMCDFPIRPEGVLETDGVRSKNKISEEYSDDKLAIEETIYGRKFDWVILRIPDVIGKRDTTERIQESLINILEGKKSDADSKELTLSLVDTRDVADFIIGCMEKFNCVNEIYNLASDPISYGEFAAMFGDADGLVHYPSVDFGPINTAKAQGLGFKFRSVRETMEDSLPSYVEHILQNFEVSYEVEQKLMLFIEKTEL